MGSNGPGSSWASGDYRVDTVSEEALLSAADDLPDLVRTIIVPAIISSNSLNSILALDVNLTMLIILCTLEYSLRLLFLRRPLRAWYWCLVFGSIP